MFKLHLREVGLYYTYQNKGEKKMTECEINMQEFKEAYERACCQQRRGTEECGAVII